MHDRKRKLLVTLAVVGALGSVAAYGTFAAFSSTTSNNNNSFAAGSVSISDNDSGGAMFSSITGQKPGVENAVDKCIRVSYSGSLDADVKMYAAGIAAGGQHIRLVVTRGTQTTPVFPDCTGFVPEVSDVYAGTLKNFGDTHTQFSNGFAIQPSSVATKWTGGSNEAVILRFRMYFLDSGSGATSGNHSFTWEAQNRT